jgi:hypothetical protein
MPDTGSDSMTLSRLASFPADRLNVMPSGLTTATPAES